MDEATRLQSEIDALKAVLSALDPLDDDTRRRVMAYAQQRFGVVSILPSGVPETAATFVPPNTVEPSLPATGQITDIRSLKEAKEPKSATEMAVIVAYYLRESAPSDERKETIGTKDIDQYFKQADYPLPSVPRNVLMFAKNSGYLDAAPTRGQYSLNPVGHNLVAHGLPRAQGSKSSRTRTTRTKTQGKKSAPRSRTTTGTKRGSAKKRSASSSKSKRASKS